MAISSQIAAVKTFIRKNWANTIRYPEQQSDAELALPHPFTVPTAGEYFHVFFYWDTFFTSEGLLRDGYEEVAKANADNFIHLIETLGYVPNLTLKAHLNRSQPPVASVLFRKIYELTGDRQWLERAYAALEKEYAFWMSMRVTPNELNHYGQHASPDMIKSFTEAFEVGDRLHLFPDEPVAKMRFLIHAMAEAESGWDFTPRFEQRCANFNPVDLNSLLFMLETNAAWFCQELGKDGADLWEGRAERRRQRINRYNWNAEDGFYFDYNYVDQRPSPIAAVSAYFALWAGLASSEQAGRMVENLPILERDYGIISCAPGVRPKGQTFQWDTPNAWPPAQYGVIAGLRQYGYNDQARRIAEKYVTTVARNFESTGNLWEKYNAITGGTDVADEYKMPAMLGWTAGVFLYACELL